MWGGGDSSVCADAELAELPASSSHFLIAMLSSTLTYACCKSGSIRDLFDWSQIRSISSSQQPQAGYIQKHNMEFNSKKYLMVQLKAIGNDNISEKEFSIFLSPVLQI